MSEQATNKAGNEVGSITVALPGWQPIETAPRDGTAILIFEPNGHYGTLTASEMPARFKVGVYFNNDPRLLRYDDYRFAIGYWTPRHKWGNRNCADVNPTHWMPLPAPPEAT